MIYLALYCIPIVVIQGIHIWEYVGWAKIAARKDKSGLVRSYSSCVSRFWSSRPATDGVVDIAIGLLVNTFWPITLCFASQRRITPFLPFRELKAKKPPKSPKVGNYFYRRERRKLTEGRAEAGQMSVVEESTEGRVSWVSATGPGATGFHLEEKLND